MTPPLPRAQLAMAAGLGLVVGLSAHLVAHSSQLLGAGSMGRSGIGVAWLIGLVGAVGVAVATGVGATRRALVGTALAYGVAFAAAAFLVGPWITAG